MRSRYAQSQTYAPINVNPEGGGGGGGGRGGGGGGVRAGGGDLTNFKILKILKFDFNRVLQSDGNLKIKTSSK